MEDIILNKCKSCHDCDNYKNGYCDVLDMNMARVHKWMNKETHIINIQEICEKVKDLSKRIGL